MKLPENIYVECVFCSSTRFLIPYNNYHPSENELLQCANCGRINSFSDIRDLAVHKYVHAIRNELCNTLKKAGFKIKHNN